MNDRPRYRAAPSRAPPWFSGSAASSALAQGFAGLGNDRRWICGCRSRPGFSFPADHGPHPDIRIEWWYVTANLLDSSGVAYGAQWTLFRQASRPGAQPEGWANPQIWMGHAARDRRRSSSIQRSLCPRRRRPGRRHAQPFRPGSMHGTCAGADRMQRHDARAAASQRIGRGIRLRAAARHRSTLVLQGDAGYSRKSQRGQASYYYSQPYFKATGRLTIEDSRLRSPDRPGWTANGAASRSPRIRADGTGSRCI